MKKLLLFLKFFTFLLLTNNGNLFSMNNNEKLIEEKKEQTEDYLLLTKEELKKLVQSKSKEDTTSEDKMLEAFAEINNANLKDKNQKTEIILTFYKNKNDSNPTYLITTLHTLLDETSSWIKKIPQKIAQLHIYIFTFKPINFKQWDETLEKDTQKTKETAEKFSNRIYSLFPNIKNLSVNLSSFCPKLPCKPTKEQCFFYLQLQNKAKTILIMSLLNKNWTFLNRISIIPGIYSLRDKRLLKIFNQLSNITSLKSVTLSGENYILRTGATGLKSVAQHALIKKLNALTLFFNPAYVDNENLETIKSLFQKNIAQNTTITLERSTTLFDGEQQFKDIVITKKQKDESENKNVPQSINIINPEDTSTEYEIHLTWVNNNPCDYFAQDEETTNKIVTAAIGWALKNPIARVFIWYDSKFITNPTSVNNIEKQVKKNASNISFIDIRNLKRVKKNPKVFSAELPVYFRADLVREIIIYEMLRLHEADCIIYADIDMTPLTQKQLFDTETVDLLNRYGIVLARVPGEPDKPYENSFQMVVDNKKTTKAIKHMLINTNIEIAKEFLNPPSEKKQMDLTMHFDLYGGNMPQIVYRFFPAMFHYLYFLNGIATLNNEKITLTNDGENNKKKIIDKATHLFWEYHSSMVGKTISSSFKLNEGYSNFYPTKLIKIPLIGGKYC